MDFLNSTMTQTFTMQQLTPTEVKVLAKIAQGLSSQQTADKLVCSKRTIDFHLNNIYVKLDVNSRTSAVAKAFQNKILSTDLLTMSDEEMNEAIPN